jgi:predicted transcriptional regulator
MSKEMFIKSVENCIEKYPQEFTEEAIKYFTSFKNIVSEEKEEFTETGKRILICMQASEKEMWKAKDIADEIEISSKSVSGSMRKLVTDGYVEKQGKNPVIYTLTLKGKEKDLNN